MPELPEVETVAQGLRRRALGRRIVTVEVRHAAVIAGSAEEFASTLEGRTLVSVSRKGKAIAVELAAPGRFFAALSAGAFGNDRPAYSYSA